MSFLLKLSDLLKAPVEFCGRWIAWIAVVIIAVIMFDVISRRFFSIGSSKLQELEWHLHTLLFMFTLGIGYLHNTHVRIDIIREKLGRRSKCVIEILGCLLFLIPFCIVVIYFGTDMTWRSWEKGEVSASATGLPFRWLIKSAVPLGMTLLLMAGLSVLLRRIVSLFRPDLYDSDQDDAPDLPGVEYAPHQEHREA